MKGNTHGYKAYYSCNHGYKLQGDDYITCDYGKWIGIIPTCKRKALKSNKIHLHAQLISYVCVLFKHHITMATYIITAIQCKALMAPQYGRVDIKGYGHGSMALYACNHGYTLYGGEYITCNYGVWKGRIPVCKRKFTNCMVAKSESSEIPTARNTLTY